MYAALARAVLDERHGAAVAERVERLKRRHPRASRDELASRLIRSAAWQCGAAAVAWSGPASFFGSMPLGPDLGFQVVTLNRLILALAAVYRSDSSGKDRIAGIATGVGAGLAADSLRRGIVALLSRTLSQRPGARAVVGGLAGGALAYAMAMAVGNLARDVFAARGSFLRRRPSW
ncbi:MAG TPA: hypothetical protein VGH97_16980 [Thermoanaerobaculia bacterium]|jgi:hypothetical protein